MEYKKWDIKDQMEKLESKWESEQKKTKDQK